MEGPIEIIYQDRRVLVAVKPVGVLSTNGPGGMPELVRQALGQPEACIRTVHRLDQVVGGLMVFARSRQAASILSEDIRAHRLEKRYFAVVHGCPPAPEGTLRDLLWRSPQERKTYVTHTPGKGVLPAELSYRTLEGLEAQTLVEITLGTGRTHQIRAQFATRGMPLVGDRKYGAPEAGDGIALWSCRLGFRHPETGEELGFFRRPPREGPWARFSCWPSLPEAAGAWGDVPDQAHLL